MARMVMRIIFESSENHKIPMAFKSDSEGLHTYD